MTETNGRLIVKTPGHCGGMARVRSMSLSVASIILMHRQGESLEEIAEAYRPHLPIQEVKAALSYYEKNKEEIEKDIYEISNPPRGYRVGASGILIEERSK